MACATEDRVDRVALHAFVRVHGTTFERPIDRFPPEQQALRPFGNHPSYLRVRHMTRKAASDGRMAVDTNRYSVPPQFIGATLDVVIESDMLQVLFEERVRAEHAIHPGRHQIIEDPGHVVSYREGKACLGKPSKIRRPLSHYAAIVGGEAW